MNVASDHNNNIIITKLIHVYKIDIKVVQPSYIDIDAKFDVFHCLSTKKKFQCIQSHSSSYSTQNCGSDCKQNTIQIVAGDARS